MKKQNVIVPKGIRYIGDWKEFNIPDFPCIINKQLTGCGFTEFCITNNENVILCSPRKILLENKEEQHPEVLYVRNEFEKSLEVDKDLSSITKQSIEEPDNVGGEDLQRRIDEMKSQIKTFVLSRLSKRFACKILVTYDSFRYVKEALAEIGVAQSFRVIVDEWQSIFTDSTFKSSTEIEFIDFLRDVQRLCYVSATPMIDKYLEMLDEFKDLPYYELDWASEDPGRIIRPNLLAYPCRSIIKTALDIIESYRDSSKHTKSSSVDSFGRITEVESIEAVLYVNSVKNICDIIKKAGLTLSETNVLCARTPENEKKVRKAFGVTSKEQVLGKVPTKGESRKMFTLCTRTVYLGADFYSTNARTFIFSDANVDSLTVDITLDLPQILGRQRLDENPWKNAAELYYKTTTGEKISPELFKKKMEERDLATQSLLRSYDVVPDSDKHYLASKYQRDAKSSNYKYDYVAVNTHGGKDLVPVFNNLVKIANLRTYEIQQIDYCNRFSVFSSLKSSIKFSDASIDSAISEFYSLKTIVDRLKFMCEINLNNDQLERFICRVPTMYQNYYRVLGIERIKAFGYNKYYLDKEYNRLFNNQGVDESQVKEEIFKEFVSGNRYIKSEVKQILGQIYSKYNYLKTPKATDLEDYFELKRCTVTLDGKKQEALEIIRKKE